MSAQSKTIRERKVQHATRHGNMAAGRSVAFNDDVTQQAVIFQDAFERPSLALARFLVSQGQLIEELALNQSPGRIP